jgi:hypothetical protein
MMEEWGDVVFERKDILDETTIKQMEEMLERKMPDEWDDTQKKLSLAWGGNNIMLMLSQSYLDEIKRLEKKQKLADEYIKLLEEKNEINRKANEKASMWENRAKCGTVVIENLHKENEKLKKDLEYSTGAIQECVKGWGQMGLKNELLKKENKKLQEELDESNRILVEKDIDAAESDEESEEEEQENAFETLGKYQALLDGIDVFEIVKKTPKRIQIKMGDKTFLRGVKKDGKGKYILLHDWINSEIKVYWKNVKCVEIH